MNSNKKLKTITVSQLGQIVTGHTPPRKIKTFFGDHTTWIKPTDIDISSRYVKKTEEKYSKKAFEKYNASLLPPLSTCVVTIGTVGEKICLTREASFTNQAINSIIPNRLEYDPMFVYYLMKYNLHLVELRHSGTASGRQNISKSSFSTIKLQVPDLPTQKIIGWVLSKYDDLIENQKEIIQTLELILKLIFNEWFSKFRFPGYKKTIFTDSEIGKIPKNWRYTNLDDILTALESGNRPKGGVKDIFEGVPSIGAENIDGLGNYDFSKERYVPEDFFKNLNRGIVHNHDVLLYKDGANIGRKTMFKSNYPHENCCINEHVFLLRTEDNVLQNYLYFWLDQRWMTENIKKLNSNSAQPGINKEDVKSLSILIPPKNLILQFNNMSEPLLEMLFSAAKKHSNITKIRDLLILKFINGIINTTNLNIEIPESKS